MQNINSPGIYPGDWNARSKKVRPQKLQKAKTLHAPQNKKQISSKVRLWQNHDFKISFPSTFDIRYSSFDIHFYFFEFRLTNFEY